MTSMTLLPSGVSFEIEKLDQEAWGQMGTARLVSIRVLDALEEDTSAFLPLVPVLVKHEGMLIDGWIKQLNIAHPQHHNGSQWVNERPKITLELMKTSVRKGGVHVFTVEPSLDREVLPEDNLDLGAEFNQ